MPFLITQVYEAIHLYGAVLTEYNPYLTMNLPITLPPQSLADSISTAQFRDRAKPASLAHREVRT